MNLRQEAPGCGVGFPAENSAGGRRSQSECRGDEALRLVVNRVELQPVAGLPQPAGLEKQAEVGIEESAVERKPVQESADGGEAGRGGGNGGHPPYAEL